MVRSFTLILLALVFTFSASAQCTPDSSISGLYSPSELEGLPDAQVGVEYNTVITVNVPVDTTYLTLTAIIDSMVLTDVTGLPPGFTYQCVPNSCSIEGGEVGCLLVTGINNNNAEVGTYDIEAEFVFYIKQPVITMPYTLTGYSITLEEGTPMGIHDWNESDLKFNIEPNPINARSKLVFDLPSSDRYAIDVYSLLGTKVAHFEDRGARGEHTFPFTEFSKQSGVYFISISQGDYSRSMRFIVQ